MLRAMPRVRLFGNSLLSLVSKFASGYWDIMDPTNGFTAVHRDALALLPLDKIDRGYFFESDMLFGSTRSAPWCATCRCRPATPASRPACASDASRRCSRSSTYAPREAPVLRVLPAGLQRRHAAVRPRDAHRTGRRGHRRRLLAALGDRRRADHVGTGHDRRAADHRRAQLLIAALNYDIGSVPREPLQRRPILLDD
jgi:hypothetical protein